MNRRSFLQRLGMGVASAALQGHILFRELVPVPEIIKINRFHGSFAELLSPGLREVFVKYFMDGGYDIFNID